MGILLRNHLAVATASRHLRVRKLTALCHRCVTQCVHHLLVVHICRPQHAAKMTKRCRGVTS